MHIIFCLNDSNGVALGSVENVKFSKRPKRINSVAAILLSLQNSSQCEFFTLPITKRVEHNSYVFCIKNFATCFVSTPLVSHFVRQKPTLVIAGWFAGRS